MDLVSPTWLEFFHKDCASPHLKLQSLVTRFVSCNNILLYYHLSFPLGYMFGKGIYFADMVSKSANYCVASKSNPVGLLLLCDVALGNWYFV